MKNFENKAKIAKVSRVIRAILYAGLVILILAELGQLFVLFSDLFLQPWTPERLCRTVFNTLMLPLAFMVNFFLFRFFARLEKGHLFDAQTVWYLSATGRWWIALWVYETLFTIVGSTLFPGMNGSLGSVSDGGLFAALCVIFTAWLFREAQELQQDRELTV